MRWFRSVICELSYHISTGVYRVGYGRAVDSDVKQRSVLVEGLLPAR